MWHDREIGEIGQMRTGPGTGVEPEPHMGPLVTREHQQKVSSYIDLGVEEGATLVCDGRGLKVEGYENGFYVGPTLFDRVTPQMRIYKEEIFGPVLVIATYESEEEALALANDSIYGLSGGVWSADEERAMAFARGMRTGQVSINGGPFNISAPFGGYKMSGNGRELGLHGLEEFLEIKSIQRPVE